MTNGKSIPRPRGKFMHVFGIPSLLAVLSIIGLVAALVGDGPLDFLSWATLGIPVAVMVWALHKRTR